MERPEDEVRLKSYIEYVKEGNLHLDYYRTVELLYHLETALFDKVCANKYYVIGTPDEVAAYKRAVDFSKAKAKELKKRIDVRSAANYHDESKRVLIFEERRMAYLDVVEAAEAALAAKEGERE